MALPTRKKVPATNIGSMLEETQQEVIIEEAILAIEEEDEDGEGGGITEADEGPNPEQAKIYFDGLRENLRHCSENNERARTYAPTKRQRGWKSWLSPF